MSLCLLSSQRREAKNNDFLDMVLYVLILNFENTTFLHCYDFGFGIKFSNIS